MKTNKMRLKDAPIGSEVLLTDGPFEGYVFFIEPRHPLATQITATRLSEPGGEELGASSYHLSWDTSCMIVDNEEK